MKLAVCWKWTSLDFDSDDPDDVDPRWAGVSPADEAALELALRVAGAARSARHAEPVDVAVFTVGPAGAADVLRSALAVGADRAVRVDTPLGVGSLTVARLLADAIGEVDQVWCGDYSLDNGSGTVPAYLAGLTGSAQALGLVAVDTDLGNTAVFDPGTPLQVTRRLDGGRREQLEVGGPAVLSVEGSVATLRRASLAATLAAKEKPIEVIASPPVLEHTTPLVEPYRPRPRSAPAPVGDTLDRVRSILDVGGSDGSHSELVTLDPPDAADRIVDQLRTWGYLD